MIHVRLSVCVFSDKRTESFPDLWPLVQLARSAEGHIPLADRKPPPENLETKLRSWMKDTQNHKTKVPSVPLWNKYLAVQQEAALCACAALHRASEGNFVFSIRDKSVRMESVVSSRSEQKMRPLFYPIDPTAAISETKERLGNQFWSFVRGQRWAVYNIILPVAISMRGFWFLF